MGLGETAASRGAALLQLTSSACPPALGYSPRFDPDCGAYTESTLEHVIADVRIRDIVLVANYQQYLSENWPALAAGLGRTISALQAAGKRVTLQAPVPNFHYPVPDALGELVFRHRAPSAYGVDKREYLQVNAGVLTSLYDLSTRYVVPLISPAAVLCPTDRCRAVAGSTALYFDEFHLSIEGVRLLQPLYQAVFDALPH